MKFTVDVECTPEEARNFLGLPDMTRVHDLYIQSVMDAMSGQTNVEQMQRLVQTLSPLGDAGLKLFSNLMDIGIGGTGSTTGGGGKKKSG